MAGLGLIYLMEFLLCGLILRPTATTNTEGMQIVLLILNSFLMIAKLSTAIKDWEGKRLNGMLIASFILHIIVLLWDVYARNIYVLPNAEGDAMGYHSVAQHYAFGSLNSIVNFGDYSFYISLLYRMIGAQRLTAQFVNIYFAMWSIVLVANITYMLDIDIMTRSTAIRLLCFLPNLLIISSILLQESFVALCLTGSVYYFTKWWLYGNTSRLIISGILSVIGAQLHLGGLVAVMGIAIAYFFINKYDRTLNISIAKLLFGILVGVIGISIISRFGGSMLDKLGGELSAEAILNNSGQTDRLTDADYLIGNMGMNSTTGLIILTPIRMLFFVCSPLPWMWRGIPDLIAFFGSALFYIITVKAAWTGMRMTSRSDSIKSYMFVLIVILIFAAVMFGWGVSNTGTALRHREKFTYLCGLLYAVSKYAMTKANNENYYSNYSGL